MPTLERKIADGEYYVRHFFHQYNTWQMLGEGVRILGHRGVTEGNRFSTDLFMDLWMKGLVYHGLTIPTGTLRPCRDSGAVDDLQKRISEFYRLVYAQKPDAAWTFVAAPVLDDDSESLEVAFARFINDVRDLGLTGWKRTDSPQVCEWDFEVVREGQVTFQATRRGTTYIRLSMGTERRDLKEYWLYAQDNWWLWWRGFRCDAVIDLNLVPPGRPCWKLVEHPDSTATLAPSVWRRAGCKSHFWIREGRIVWVPNTPAASSRRNQAASRSGL